MYGLLGRSIFGKLTAGSGCLRNEKLQPFSSGLLKPLQGWNQCLWKYKLESGREREQVFSLFLIGLPSSIKAHSSNLHLHSTHPSLSYSSPGTSIYLGGFSLLLYVVAFRSAVEEWRYLTGIVPACVGEQARACLKARNWAKLTIFDQFGFLQ